MPHSTAAAPLPLTPRRPRRPCRLALLALLPLPVDTHELRLLPDRDNTLYETTDGSKSNAVGEHVFAGTTGIGAHRRALLHFDLTGIPDGATITAARLRMSVSKASPFASPSVLALHRLLDDWGEGTSDAPGEEGKGADSTPGDATWLHRFYPSELWSTPGGDFDPGGSTPGGDFLTGPETPGDKEF